jgi:hypothetical protein
VATRHDDGAQDCRGGRHEGYQHSIDNRVLGRQSPEWRTLSELANSLEQESSTFSSPATGSLGRLALLRSLRSRYTSNETNALFVGYPVDDPDFWFTSGWRNRLSPWGSVAVPVFRNAVEQLVVLLNIPPDDVRKLTHD